MLQGDMVEARTGTIIIQDMEANTLELVIAYIYTGQLEAEKDVDINKMINAADKYDLPGLKALVYLKVASGDMVVKHELIADMLVTANLHQSRELEEVALKRIKGNKEILEDPEFRRKLKETHNLDI